MASDFSQFVQSFKVKGSTGNVYLVEEVVVATYEEAANGLGHWTAQRTSYRVASSHMQVNYDEADDSFRIFGSSEVLRRI